MILTAMLDGIEEGDLRVMIGNGRDDSPDGAVQVDLMRG
jgi:hypothetical protein